MRAVRGFASLLAVVMSVAAVAGKTPAPPTSVVGHYEGAIAIMGTELAIKVDFASGPQGLAASIDIPQQGARAMPLSNVGYRPPRVHFELPAGPGLATFDGEASGDRSRDVHAGRRGRHVPPPPAGARRPVAPAMPTPPPYREEEVTFTSPDGTFAGTLTSRRAPDRTPP